MARNLGVLVRQLLGNSNKSCAELTHHLKHPSNSIQTQTFKTLTLALTLTPTRTTLSSSPTFPSSSLHSPNVQYFLQQRRFSSSPAASNIVLINSENDFYAELNTVYEESLSAVFYLTTYRFETSTDFVFPVLGELSEQCPHVTIYKMVLLEEPEWVGSSLGPFDLTALPMLIFFKKGKTVAEDIGLNIKRLQNTFGKLYRRARRTTQARKDKKGCSKIANVESPAQFDRALRKVAGGSSRAILFYSAVVCDACASMYPVIQELSEQFPHVKVYKIKEHSYTRRQGREPYLYPKFIFYKDGKNVSELVGDNPSHLKLKFAKYYRSVT